MGEGGRGVGGGGIGVFRDFEGGYGLREDRRIWVGGYGWAGGYGLVGSPQPLGWGVPPNPSPFKVFAGNHWFFVLSFPSVFNGVSVLYPIPNCQ